MRLNAVIACGHDVALVLTTVDSVRRQAPDAGVTLIAPDDDRVGPWFKSIAATRGFGLVVAPPGAFPGIGKNRALEALGPGLALFLRSGDMLEAFAVDRLTQALDSNSEYSLVWATCGADGPTPRRSIDGVSVDMTLGISVLRAEVWRELRFNERLPALDLYEFALRVRASGRHVGFIDMPLVRRPAEMKWPHLEHEVEAWVEAIRIIDAVHPTALAIHQSESQALLRDLTRQRGDLERRIASMKAEFSGLHRRIEHEPTSARAAGRVALPRNARRTPASLDWGFGRGTPIDRLYIGEFIQAHLQDIQGDVLEIQDPRYAPLGGKRVKRIDVLDTAARNSAVTVVADLQDAPNIPSLSYDCVILTQTLQLIPDPVAALRESARILRPGGVLILSVPVLSRVANEYGDDLDRWRMTASGLRSMLIGVAQWAEIEVHAAGNVLAASAFLYGLAVEEFGLDDLQVNDPSCPVVVMARACRGLEPTSTPQREGTRITRSRATGAVLLYHRVARSSRDPHGLCVSPADFERQVRHLAAEYDVLDLGEFALMAASEDLPHRAVAITFDDGYVDNLAASKILAEAGLPATFFLTTELLESLDYRFWWDTLEDALQVGSAGKSELVIALPTGTVTFSTATPAARLETYLALHRALVLLTPEQRDAFVSEVRAWVGRFVETPQRRRMTSAEILELASRPGQVIGAHSVCHPRLTVLSPTDCHQEIAASRDVLCSLIRRPVDRFAYPFGAVNADVVSAVRAAGIAVGVECGERTVGGVVNALCIPRIQVRPDVSSSFSEWLDVQFQSFST